MSRRTSGLTWRHWPVYIHREHRWKKLSRDTQLCLSLLYNGGADSWGRFEADPAVLAEITNVENAKACIEANRVGTTQQETGIDWLRCLRELKQESFAEFHHDAESGKFVGQLIDFKKDGPTNICHPKYRSDLPEHDSSKPVLFREEPDGNMKLVESINTSLNASSSTMKSWS